MTLGGYQKIDLSPADLTASTLRLDGLSKACAGANGKAALIKTPEGNECFGAVGETDSGFDLSFMNSDSSVVKVSVDDTDDTFTLEESDAVTASPKWVMDYANKVDLTSTYNSGNPYNTPCDGYLYCVTGATSNSAVDLARCSFRTKNGNSTQTISIFAYYNSAGDSTAMLFVKKGIKAWGSTAGTGTGTKAAYFFPLIKA